MEYKWKIVKLRKHRKRNVDPLKQIEGRASYLANLGQTLTLLHSRPINKTTSQRRCQGGPARGAAALPLVPRGPTFGRVVTVMLLR